MNPYLLAKLVYEPNGCLVWTGAIDQGYGKFNTGRKNYRVHRLVYTLLVGEIPAGLDLDHLCCNKACANPLHLEPVTRWENTLRAGTASSLNYAVFCKRGHQYTPDNTLWWRGTRRCRICRKAARRVSAA